MVEDECSNLSVVFQVVKNIEELINNDLIIVTKSIVPVGTGIKLKKLFKKD